MKKYILMIAVAAFAFASCREKDDPEVVDNSSIELSSYLIEAGPDGGSYNISVNSSDSWRVSGLCDWVSFASEEGSKDESLVVNVDANETMDERTAEFKVFTGSAVKTLKVISSPTYGIVLSSEDSIRVSSDENTFTVTLVSNVTDFQYEMSNNGQNWITPVSVEEAFGKKIIKFSVDRSFEFKERNSVITLSGEGVTQQGQFTLWQDQRDTAFVVGENRIIKDLQAYDIPLVIKSNIDFKYDLPSWLTEVSKTTSEADDSGLSTTNLTVHCDACGGSRLVNLDFYQNVQSGYYTNKNVYGTVMIKQQNPNPTFVTIKDADLRSNLNDKEWILDDGTEKAEVLEAGMTGTSLTIGSDSRWGSSVTIQDISGLGGFPCLTSVTLQYMHAYNVDFSDCTNLTSVTCNTLYNLETINFGDNKITSFSIGDQTYIKTSTTLTVKGTYLEDLDLTANTYYVSWYEALQAIDVTGCPALKTLKAKRSYNSWGYEYKSPYTTIYMTSAQQSSVEVTKSDDVSIVVK